MDDDIRCCGTGTCLINAEGFCWCGQQWDGAKMCFPAKSASEPSNGRSAAEREAPPSDTTPLP